MSLLDCGKIPLSFPGEGAQQELDSSESIFGNGSLDVLLELSVPSVASELEVSFSVIEVPAVIVEKLYVLGLFPLAGDS